MNTFSQRQGIHQPDAPITIRHEAPDWLRSLLVRLAYDAEFKPSTLREILCDLLLETPDPSNWSEWPNVDSEVHSLIHRAQWFEVYDFVEVVANILKTKGASSILGPDPAKLEAFTSRVNEAFRRKGVGWQLVDGQLQMRGEETFESSVRSAVEITGTTGRNVAQTEFHGALLDLSKRPNADITGAIRHAMAALECVARDVTGDPNATLGEIIKRHPTQFSPPLDKGLEKLWGFASDQARHVREGTVVDIRDAELLVGIAGSVATYLIKKCSGRST